MTQFGGSNVLGTIFEVTQTGTETVLYSFCSQSNCDDGELPESGLTIDSTGNLYGTTPYGGPNSDGNVFELSTNGTFTTLYSFGGNDGSDPRVAPVLDGSGNLYGTTAYGGGSGCNGFGCGTVYEVTPSGTETVLHAFQGGSDGMGLFGSVYLDKSGNVYGTTLQGGSGCDYGCGTVFKITPSGSKSTVHAFTEAEGTDSLSGLVADKKGYLYGTTRDASTYGYGSVFKVKE